MCSVCNCFSWTLDLFQRALTFCLSCWLAFATCCGLGIAVIAGIAYGYNYCLAEFITLTRSDIRVYMRRGQFYDRPDLLHVKRRMGNDEEVIPFNLTEDYQQEVPSTDETALSNKWMKDEDIRKYAEKLTKYSENRKSLKNESSYEVKKPSALYLFPNSTISKSIRYSGTSEVKTRMFEPFLETEEGDSVEDDHNNTKVNTALDRILAKTSNAEDEYVEFIPSTDRQIEDR
ncbi:unnamed protein product [Euphydryas editha]|uniref:Uncharacterized protein n=1 Tax=Euphydryas editha TaxID=104508 RepID=A0AAU9U8Y9_EUPED|nr:unnamed protein product [Euphydryas editha]